MADPTSYSDPYWTQLASSTEDKLGLPTGLLQSIITHGERSNADQVSEAGARTVAQIIPSTRKAAIEKYGVDPYLSGQNAVEVAGRLLKDSLDRHDGDVGAAVGEYHGGTDPANWGPKTKAYVARVTRGHDAIQTDALGKEVAAFKTAWGKIWGKVPGSERNAFESWVESLKGQLGFQSLMAAKQASPTGASGFGALSDSELKMLSGLAGRLDTDSKDFPVVLGKVEKFLQKTQARAVANPNLPTSGGAFVANSPKYGTIDEGRINAVLRAHPELTRADVLRYLQQQGQ
jgi:hypothetical protein